MINMIVFTKFTTRSLRPLLFLIILIMSGLPLSNPAFGLIINFPIRASDAEFNHINEFIDFSEFSRMAENGEFSDIIIFDRNNLVTGVSMSNFQSEKVISKMVSATGPSSERFQTLINEWNNALKIQGKPLIDQRKGIQIKSGNLLLSSIGKKYETSPLIGEWADTKNGVKFVFLPNGKLEIKALDPSVDESSDDNSYVYSNGLLQMNLDIDNGIPDRYLMGNCIISNNELTFIYLFFDGNYGLSNSYYDVIINP